MCRPARAPIALLALTLLLAHAPLSPAEEVVVKNDSVVDFSSAYVVGDFVAGEHAGVRLQAPCNGAIVAVQILWLEGPPGGNPPSLEEAIHIYDDGIFPIPGTELETLVGPVLTPGGFNEFRYIDEQQTVPLNVPVVGGQYFYITLEFYNPTNVGGGGASVVRDLDGCQPDANVLYGDLGLGYNWYNFCILLSGDLAIRAVIDCPGQLGACCYADGTCANDVEQGDCESEFGAVWYNGLSCSEVTCPDPRGACCNGSGGCLQLQTQSFCETTLGGIYAGHGTNCDDGVCDLGACCFPAGSCSATVQIDCLTQGGTFQGVGTTCVPNPCPQPIGACCVGSNCVPDQLESACVGFGGTWVGPFTACDPDPCTGPQWCLGDANCSGDAPDFADIQYFVAALAGPNAWTDYHRTHGQLFDPPPCPYGVNDINGAGVSFEDIAPFVSLVGQPCVALQP
jgi:hypothetical protein